MLKKSRDKKPNGIDWYPSSKGTMKNISMPTQAMHWVPLRLCVISYVCSQQNSATKLLWLRISKDHQLKSQSLRALIPALLFLSCVTSKKLFYLPKLP